MTKTSLVLSNLQTKSILNCYKLPVKNKANIIMLHLNSLKSCYTVFNPMARNKFPHTRRFPTPRRLKAPTVKHYNTNVHKIEENKNKWITFRSIITLWMPFGTIVFVGWRYIRATVYGDIPKIELKVYEKLPWRITSRIWGKIAACEVPVSMRNIVYGTYVKMFNVNLEEAAVPDLKYYKSISQFFTRPLKEGVRVISTNPCVSPCDGTVLNCGPANTDKIEQVKGVTYSLEEFLGDNTWSDSKGTYYDTLLKNKNNTLHQCTIYLAPGDYHRFHSPCEWTARFRRHFSGKLLSVNPLIAKYIPGLFCLNERAVYIGDWQHGFFSYTAVGATNVGSIQIFTDEDLHTNKFKRNCIDEILLVPEQKFTKGEQFGQFNMGSTIVLIFEAPKDFKFDFKSGEKVKVGEALGKVAEQRR